MDMFNATGLFTKKYRFAFVVDDLTVLRVQRVHAELDVGLRHAHTDHDVPDSFRLEPSSFESCDRGQSGVIPSGKFAGYDALFHDAGGEFAEPEQPDAAPVADVRVLPAQVFVNVALLIRGLYQVLAADDMRDARKWSSMADSKSSIGHTRYLCPVLGCSSRTMRNAT